MAKEKTKSTGATAVAEPPVAATPAAKKAASAPAPAPPEVTYVTSTDLAARVGVKPTILRRWLRTLPQFQDNGYTRYKWDPADPFLDSAVEAYEKFKTEADAKKEAREAELAAKAEKKKAEKPVGKAKKGAPVAEVEEEEESDEEFEDEDETEGEELE